MRILITTDAFPPGAGGSGQSTAALARALADRGHEVRVVVASHREERLERQWQGVPVTEIEGSVRRPSRLVAFLEASAASRRFDLVHAQHWRSAAAAAQALDALGAPLVVTVRDYWPLCIWSTRLSGHEACPGCTYWRRVVCVKRRHPLLAPCSPLMPPVVGIAIQRRRRIVQKAARVIAVSEYVQGQLGESVEGEGGDRVVVVPNFVSSEASLGSENETLPGLPESFVLFVGKLEPNKAPDRLIPVLRRAGVDLPLVVAGEGRLQSELSRMARAQGIEAHFTGWVSEAQVPRLMKRATAVLFPSRWQEPLSRVLLEGLAAGAVLIVQPTGGSAEIVIHEQSGLLAPTETDMAESLRRVIEEPELADRLRAGAIRRAQTHFSPQVVLPLVEGVYRRAAGQGPDPPPHLGNA